MDESANYLLATGSLTKEEETFRPGEEETTTNCSYEENAYGNDEFEEDNEGVLPSSQVGLFKERRKKNGEQEIRTTRKDFTTSFLDRG